MISFLTREYVTIYHLQDVEFIIAFSGLFDWTLTEAEGLRAKLASTKRSGASFHNIIMAMEDYCAPAFYVAFSLNARHFHLCRWERHVCRVHETYENDLTAQGARLVEGCRSLNIIFI